MDTSQAVEDMGRKMQEYQARIEELEKAAAASATKVSDGARAAEAMAEDEARPTQGTDRQVIVPIIEKVPIKLGEKIWGFQYVDFDGTSARSRQAE